MGTPAASRRYLIWIACVTASMAVALAVLLMLQLAQDRNIRQTHAHRADALSGLAFQFDREFLRFQDALELAASSKAAPDPAKLQLRLDILVSRRVLLDQNPSGHDFINTPRFRTTMPTFDALVEKADALLTRPPLQAAALAALSREFDTIGSEIQALSRAANDSTTRLVESQQNALLAQHQRFLWLTLAQLAVLLAAAATLVVRHRRQEQARQASEELNHDLRKSRQQAEAANLSKSRFLSNMSHELRTPLNGMLGMLSILQASGLDSQQRGYVKVAYDSADHLQVLINDLIDLSAMEEGKIALNAEPVDLHALLISVGELIRPQAAQKGLTFVVDADDRLSRLVLGDPTRIKQIVLNLLSNAIKFSDRGRVSLLAQPVAPTPEESARAPDPSRLHLHIRVIDQGIGMDSATVSRLFRRFESGDTHTLRRFGGSGLGMEISRKLAQMMGGDITVSSRPHTGSTFTLDLRLPLVQPFLLMDTPSAPVRTREAGTPGLDIVVAEDHPVNRLYVKSLLERLGHGVRFAVDGEKAVEETRRQVPDLVLMDLHMPKVDGFEAARQLRNGHDAAAQVPIVALTADVLQESRVQASEAGMQAYLTKPLQPDQIAQLLVQMFGVRGAAERAPAGGKPVAANTPSASDARLASASTPISLATPGSAIDTHLDMVLINEACAAMNVAGYRLLLNQLMQDESRKLYSLCALLQGGVHPELAPTARTMQTQANRLGLIALAKACAQIEAFSTDLDASTQKNLCDRLKSAITTTHALAASMGLTSAPFPSLPQAAQTTTGSGSSMMPKRS
jgi:signal transduction histidine kinase/DNA-binding response OmpR family regulator